MPNAKKKTVIRTSAPVPIQTAGPLKPPTRENQIAILRAELARLEGQPTPAAIPEPTPARQSAPSFGQVNGTTNGAYKRLPFLADHLEEVLPAGRRVQMKIIGNSRPLDTDKFESKPAWYGPNIPAHLKIYVDVEIDGKEFTHAFKPTDLKLWAIFEALAQGKPVEIERGIYNDSAYVEVVRSR